MSTSNFVAVISTRHLIHFFLQLTFDILITSGMPDDGTEDEGEPGGSSSAELGSAMGDHHADLFSEVHLHEITRLEKQLEQAHSENVSEHFASFSC